MQQRYHSWALWCDSSPILYVFELTWSSKSLQNVPKLPGQVLSKTTQHISNPQIPSTQWPGPSILILMGPAMFFFWIGGLREAFWSKMCLLASCMANCQLSHAWQWPRPLKWSNKWPSSLIMIIMEPSMVYLEIWLHRLGFWGWNVAEIYFPPVVLLLKPIVSVKNPKMRLFNLFCFIYFVIAFARHMRIAIHTTWGVQIAKSNLASARWKVAWCKLT